MKGRTVAVLILLWLAALTAGVWTVAAEEDVNVGILRVSVQRPMFAAPSSHVSFLVDVEYAVHDNASIKSGLFSGTLGDLGQEVWQSEPILINGPTLGDEIWTVNLTAPANEGEWQFVAFAYYQNAGKYSPNDTANNQASWSYYNDTDHGPGFLEFTVRISQTAQLEVDLGIPNAPVKIGGSTVNTSGDGVVASRFNVGQNVTVSVPAVFPLQNSTQLVFQGWEDGGNSTERSVLLDGDYKLVAVYAPQYLLLVTSPVSAYAQSTWHDPGSNVTLEVNRSAPMNWPLGSLGLRYIFSGWTGDETTTSNKITVIMNTPKALRANFTPDLAQLVLPIILFAGVLGGVTLSVARRRAAAKSPPVEEAAAEDSAEADEDVAPTEERSNEGDAAPKQGSSKFCDGCGESVEEGWTHCIHCGRVLGRPSEPVQS